jgi:1-acyl-sn-glycerol-3-phosphate acyltransferase
MLAKWGIGIAVTFWGKDSLFRVPLFGRWLRWVGGVPVLRHTRQGAVGDMIERMAQAKGAGRFLWQALAPEGTRSAGGGWRSGFYQVATGADVPVALVVLDFAARRVGIVSCLHLCGHPDADMAAIAQRLADCRGARPDQAAPIRLL